MAYADTNFKTKKAFKEAVASGKKVRLYDPGVGLEKIPHEGIAFVSGPHYPEPHKWYAQVKLAGGVVVKVS